MTRIALLLAAAAIAFAGWAHAQHSATGHEHAPAASQKAPHFTDGEVKRVDKQGGNITLRHGAIPNLDMPPMSMAFRADPAMLAAVKEGDKVRFKADNVDGKLTVTELRRVN